MLSFKYTVGLPTISFQDIWMFEDETPPPDGLNGILVLHRQFLKKVYESFVQIKTL